MSTLAADNTNAHIATESTLPSATPEILLIYDSSVVSGGYYDTTFWDSVLWEDYTTYMDDSTFDGDKSVIQDFDFVFWSNTLLQNNVLTYADYQSALDLFANTSRIAYMSANGAAYSRLLNADEGAYTGAEFTTIDPTNSSINVTDDIFGDLSGLYCDPSVSKSYPAITADMASQWTKTVLGEVWASGTNATLYVKFTHENASVYIGNEYLSRELVVQLLFTKAWLYPSRYPAVVIQNDDSPSTQAQTTAMINWLTNETQVKLSFAVSVSTNVALFQQVFENFSEARVLPEAHGLAHESIAAYDETQTADWVSSQVENATILDRPSIGRFIVTPYHSNNTWIDEQLESQGYYGRIDTYDADHGSYCVLEYNYPGFAVDTDAKANNWTTYVSVESISGLIASNYWTDTTRTRYLDYILYSHTSDFTNEYKMANKTAFYDTFDAQGLPFATTVGAINGVIRAFDLKTGGSITYTNEGTYATLTSARELYIKLPGTYYANSNVIQTGQWTWVYAPADTEIRIAASVSALGGWPCISNFYGKVTPIDYDATSQTATYSLFGYYESEMSLIRGTTSDVWVATLDGISQSNSNVQTGGSSLTQYLNVTNMMGGDMTLVLRNLLSVSTNVGTLMVKVAQSGEEPTFEATPSNPLSTSFYTVHGIDADTGYKVYQDGDVIATGTGPTLSFTATGGGEFEVVVWYPKTVSSMIVLTVNMVGLGILVSVIAGWVIPFSRSIKIGAYRTVEPMMKDLIKGVVFIVIALIMWGMLHNIAIG